MTVYRVRHGAQRRAFELVGESTEVVENLARSNAKRIIDEEGYCAKVGGESSLEFAIERLIVSQTGETEWKFWFPIEVELPLEILNEEQATTAIEQVLQALPPELVAVIQPRFGTPRSTTFNGVVAETRKRVASWLEGLEAYTKRVLEEAKLATKVEEKTVTVYQRTLFLKKISASRDFSCVYLADKTNFENVIAEMGELRSTRCAQRKLGAFTSAAAKLGFRAEYMSKSDLKRVPAAEKFAL